jgi:hypothetical protein
MHFWEPNMEPKITIEVTAQELTQLVKGLRPTGARAAQGTLDVDDLCNRLLDAQASFPPLGGVPLVDWVVSGKMLEHLPLDTLRRPDGRQARRVTLGDVRSAFEEVLGWLADEYPAVRLVGANGRTYSLHVGAVLEEIEPTTAGP